MKLEQPVVLQIKKIADEAEKTKTFVFDYGLESEPGQFINLWIPKFDEKPFSISYQDDKRFAITVACIGIFTEEMRKLKEGDLIGIRGPYGKAFNLKGKNIILVGGGCGCGPLAFLADEAIKKGVDVSFIIGARTKDALLFLERMKKNNVKTFVTTDDGSFGVKGFATDLLKDFLEKNHIDAVYSCGPEKMMKKVAEMCKDKKIYCELSLERYMKCGFGVCGQCCMDDSGFRVCTDGPVINGEDALKLREFGSYRRDAAGKKVNV